MTQLLLALLTPLYIRESVQRQSKLYFLLRCRGFGAKMGWYFEKEQLGAPLCIHQFTHNSSCARPGAAWKQYAT